MPAEAGRCGYASERYARSQRHLGEPRALPASGAWLLERETPREGWRDAMGCYPLLACAEWDALAGDLEACDDLVSVVAVADPVRGPGAAGLRAAFPDLVRPFKEHFVCDLGAGVAGNRHHRYYARRALRALEVRESPSPPGDAAEWAGLYGDMAARRGWSGVHAFPAESLTAQLEVEGATLLRALEGETVVAAHLWYVCGGVAYSHLAATTPRGYELGAAYALHAAAATLLRERAELLHLGGSAGTSDRRDGLTAFKAGWSTRAVTAHLVGRIGDPGRYAALGGADSGYFPGYRAR